MLAHRPSFQRRVCFQVTWADTAEVGCATHKCPNGYTYVYCDYGEGGNMIGEPAFESGKPGSKCSSKYPGTKADDQGLCGKSVTDIRLLCILGTVFLCSLSNSTRQQPRRSPKIESIDVRLMVVVTVDKAF